MEGYQKKHSEQGMDVMQISGLVFFIDKSFF